MVTVGTYIVIVFVSYYFKYFLDMLDYRKRKSTQFVNARLEELRKIPKKSLDEQKEFTELKYPTSRGLKAKWTVKRVLLILLMLVFYAGFFIIWLKIFQYLHLEFKIWQAAIVVFLGPTIINFVLKRLGLQHNDITVFLK